MKKLFIRASYDGKIDLSKIRIKELPEKIRLVTTVQFLDYISDIEKLLEKNNKKVFSIKGNQPNKAQILGCDVSSSTKINEKVDCYLYIGDGNFHPLGIAYKTKKHVFCFNPTSGVFSKISKSDVEKYEKKRKGRILKYLSSKNIGILVSTKVGQENMKKAMKLKKKLKKKNCYIFISETVPISEFENFPYIDSWINTACPRIEDDSQKIINLSDVLEIEKLQKNLV